MMIGSSSTGTSPFLANPVAFGELANRLEELVGPPARAPSYPLGPQLSLMVKTNKTKRESGLSRSPSLCRTIRSGLVSRGGLVKGRVENLVATNLRGAFNHLR